MPPKGPMLPVFVNGTFRPSIFIRAVQSSRHFHAVSLILREASWTRGRKELGKPRFSYLSGDNALEKTKSREAGSK